MTTTIASAAAAAAISERTLDAKSNINIINAHIYRERERERERVKEPQYATNDRQNRAGIRTIHSHHAQTKNKKYERIKKKMNKK